MPKIDPSTLYADLQAEEQAAEAKACGLCDFIRAVDSEVVRDALIAASDGTLSERALHRVLSKHKAAVGIRTIKRHRTEEHKP